MEWTVVNSKTKASNKKSKVFLKFKSSLKSQHVNVTDHNIKEQDLTTHLREMSELFKLSTFFQSLWRIINEVECYSSTVSLGIGNFSKSSSALLQFSFAICLKNSFETRNSQACNGKEILKFFIYDPQFSAIEQKICEDFGFIVFSENTMGKCETIDNKNTLFFMPHCPYRLYCNLIWKNWANLEKVFILGNSFNSYDLRRFSNNTISKGNGTSSVDAVQFLLPIVEEVAIWSTVSAATFLSDNICRDRKFQYLENAFTDLSLHRFVIERIEAVDLLKNRATEADIDQAALQDCEMQS